MFLTFAEFTIHGNKNSKKNRKKKHKANKNNKLQKNMFKKNGQLNRKTCFYRARSTKVL